MAALGRRALNDVSDDGLGRPSYSAFNVLRGLGVTLS